MPLTRVSFRGDRAAVDAGLEQLRRELDLGAPHSAEAEAEAERAARGPDPYSAERSDHRHLELVTIDPDGSTDLDQAVGVQRTSNGYRVHYAIADVAAFVAPGGPLDRSTWERGVTLYAPDERHPLHPTVLSEGAASLLQGHDRPALLWTIELDADGSLSSGRLERATVRSRSQLTYAGTQARLDAGEASEVERLVAEVGALRRTIEQERGGVSLNLPDQEVRLEHGHVTLSYAASRPIENWNAQISLLAGITAAQLMVDAGVGLLRTLPPMDRETEADVQRAARHLGVEWADGEYASAVSSLDPGIPQHAAVLSHAVRTFRGASYHPFQGSHPDDAIHGALATLYSHVTAPLRRLCDRHTNEVVLAICADRHPPAWATERLPELPEVMAASRRRERSLDRAVADLAEAVILTPHVGEVFRAMVTSSDRGRSGITLPEPPVITRLETDGLEPGTVVSLRLVATDPEKRTIAFEVVDGP